MTHVRALIVVCIVSAAATAQTTMEYPRSTYFTYELDSGVLGNQAASASVVFQQTIEIEGAAWLRLHFDQVYLAPGSFVRITSLLDNEVQELDALGLTAWGHSTAYFNGDAVLLELVAAGGSLRNRVELAEVAVELTTDDPVAGLCGICGPDDRVPTNELWAPRMMPSGCSSSIWNEESCAMSAGHCVFGGEVFQFNVPLSNPNCSLNHPPVVDQFPSTGVDFTNGGVGNDWAVLTVGTNGLGETPVDRYGEFRPISDVVAQAGQTLDVTGYGTSDDCILAGTQQSSSGTCQSVQSTWYEHNVDTTFGNSGSPVLRNDEIVGVATHCLCPNNIATRVDHPDFEAARADLCGDEVTCGDILIFQQRCLANGLLQMRVILNSNAHDGDTITFWVDGDLIPAVVEVDRAMLSISGQQGTGDHQLGVFDPFCPPPVIVTCE